MESNRGSLDIAESQKQEQPNKGYSVSDAEHKDRSGLESHLARSIINVHRANLVVASPESINLAYLIRHPFKTIMDYLKDKAHGGTRRSPDIERSEDFEGAIKSNLLISIAEMQRMRLRKLQSKLIIDATNMYLGKGESRDWEVTLQQYIQAYRDYEYMTKAGLKLKSQDPFVATSDDIIVKWMMGDIWDENEKNWPEDCKISKHRWRQSLHESKNQAEPIGAVGRRVNPSPMINPLQAARQRTRFVNLLKRILIAAGGGIFLIAPMWIMVLHNTRWTALASTSVFVAIFGTVMAIWHKDPNDIVSSTAAYAAVLVIFVGAAI